MPMTNQRETRALSKGVQPLLKELQSRWIRDFLLTPAPIHLNHLLSPSLPANSILVNSHSQNALPTSKLPVGGDSNIAASCLHVPSFTVDQSTYGVSVARVQMPNTGGLLQSGSDGRPYKMDGRFVLSPSCLFFVFEYPQDDAVLVSLARQKTFTDMSAGIYLLRKSALRRESYRQEGALTAASLSSCLIYGQEDHQKTFCVKCGVHWRVPCQCKMSRDRPLHPFDISHFMRNMQPLITDYEPMRRIVFFANGQAQNWNCDAARASFKFARDTSMLNNLAAWSISEYLAGVKGIQKLPSCTTGSEDQGREEYVDEPQLICSERVATDKSSDIWCLEVQENTPGTSVDVDNITEHIAENTHRDGPNATLETAFRKSPPPTEPSTSYSSTSKALLSLQSIQKQNVDNQTLDHLRNASASQLTTSERDRNFERPGSSSNEINPSLGLKVEQALIDRAKRRREYNREAARRSNERRKQERDSLKGELRREQEHMQILRKKENELRKLNIVLRSQVKQAGIQFQFKEESGLS